MKELLFRECSRCEYIEDCPEPAVLLDGSNETPNFCPKKDEVILTKRIWQHTEKNP